MEQYDPLREIDAAEWLALDESERIALVEELHLDVEDEIPNVTLHAAIHVAVENMLALGEEPVANTIAKLTRQGLDRHEAIHAIGAVLSEDIYSLVQGGDEWNKPQFRRRLDKLTAKRWRKGQW